MRLQKITDLLSDKKAQDIQVFDLRDKNYIVDFVVIATALAGKHAYALLETLKVELKNFGEVFYGVDDENENWIVVDLGDIMIHLFTEEHRKKFDLEEFLGQIQHQKSH